jgi:CTP synthase
MAKYVIITGGVISGLGKGVTASSLGQLLKLRGLKIFMQKFDTYLNYDPGTMNPNQHGEVFVTEDGAEADLDLGHYERFTDENTSKHSNITGGKIFYSAINGERKGEYMGETIQIVPHITDIIKAKIRAAAAESRAEVVITELGGTVGDMESPPFLEAFAQFRREVGAENVFFIHQTLVPYLKNSEEFKTRPTQHSVRELRALGIEPNALVLRSEIPVPQGIKDKTEHLCALPKGSVFESHDVEVIYEMISSLKSQGMDGAILRHFGIQAPEAITSQWDDLVSRIKSTEESVRIALVGKYVSLKDAYISVYESLKHAGYQHGVNVEIDWIDSEESDTPEFWERLSHADGIIVPGGFGKRGVDGKLAAIGHARETGTPFLGICYGMQLATIEFARSVAGLADANSTEIDSDTKDPIISLQRGRAAREDLGGTLRLGSFECTLKEGSLARAMYGQAKVSERHRHRYEFNNKYKDLLSSRGMEFSGINDSFDLVEAVEIPGHPFFIGVQFHPEFKSRPLRPHPLYSGFVLASKTRKQVSR